MNQQQKLSKEEILQRNKLQKKTNIKVAKNVFSNNIFPPRKTGITHQVIN